MILCRVCHGDTFETPEGRIFCAPCGVPVDDCLCTRARHDNDPPTPDPRFLAVRYHPDRPWPDATRAQGKKRVDDYQLRDVVGNGCRLCGGVTGCSNCQRPLRRVDPRPYTEKDWAVLGDDLAEARGQGRREGLHPPARPTGNGPSWALLLFLAVATGVILVSAFEVAGVPEPVTDGARWAVAFSAGYWWARR